MSDKRQEAISDIIAEMRLGATGDMPFAYRIGRPDRIVEYKTKDGKKYVQRRAVIESVTIDELADRLDAAHKREVDNLNSVIQATVSRSDSEIDRLRWEAEELRKQIGNAAKMREALKRIKHLFRNINLYEDTVGNEAYAIADAALAEPARNCDRFLTWEAAKAAYWREQGDPADWRKLGAWLFAAKEEERGEGSPRTEQESEVK